MAGGISRGFGGRRKSLVFDEFAYRTSEKQSQQADGTGLEFRRKVGADDRNGGHWSPQQGSCKNGHREREETFF